MLYEHVCRAVVWKLSFYIVWFQFSLHRVCCAGLAVLHVGNRSPVHVCQHTHTKMIRYYSWGYSSGLWCSPEGSTRIDVCINQGSKWYFFCAVHCDTIMWHTPTNAHFSNILIQFLVSSAYFNHHVFIIRKTICTCIFMVCFLFIYVSSLPPVRLLT